jgi:hypothetical protein
MIREPHEEHYAALGKLTANWAALEMHIASAIWQIGEIPDAIGASLTAQVWGVDGRMKALQSILCIRGFDDVAKRLNVFWDKKLRALQEFRNRRIHDPVNFPQIGVVTRLEVTANKKLKMGYESETLDEMAAKIDAIADAIDEFAKIVRPALDASPPLPHASLERRGQASPPR